MQGFKSACSAQLFLHIHAPTYNRCGFQRHLVDRLLFKKLSTEAFYGWKAAALDV